MNQRVVIRTHDTHIARMMIRSSGNRLDVMNLQDRNAGRGIVPPVHLVCRGPAPLDLTFCTHQPQYHAPQARGSQELGVRCSARAIRTPFIGQFKES